MLSINKVNLVGNLDRHPEFREFSPQVHMCELIVATSKPLTKRNGIRTVKTEWHRVAIFDRQVIELARDQLMKGSKV